MPGKNKRGPQGMGPMTGRKRGLCAQAASEKIAAKEKIIERELGESEDKIGDSPVVDEQLASEVDSNVENDGTDGGTDAETIDAGPIEEPDYSRIGDGQGLGMGRRHHGGQGRGQGAGRGQDSGRGQGAGRGQGSGRGQGAGRGCGNGRGRGAGIGIGRKGGNR